MSEVAMNAIIDAATITEVKPEVEQKVETKVEEPAKEPEKPEVAEEPKKDDFEGSQKEANALRRLKNEKAQIRAERNLYREQLQAREAELAEMRKAPLQPTQGVPKTLANGEPNPEAYANYQDLQDARQDWRAEQREKAKAGEQQKTNEVSQIKQWEDKRMQEIDAQGEEFAKENPEVVELLNEYAEDVKALPQQIKHLLLEADNAPLAFFNLAKSGEIENLGTMTLAKAALTIAKAQTMVPEKPKTKAPAPMPTSRGSVASGKSPDSMDGNEIRAWMRESTA